MKRTQKGFTTIEGILVFIILVVVGYIGYYVHHSQQQTTKTLNAAQAESASKVTLKKATTAVSSTANGYLKIPELGIELPLSSSDSDAYYAVFSTKNNGQPIIDLSTHSLDKYPGCAATASNSGVADVSSFKKGYSDPVIGDYATAFPKAPYIGGLYFYVQGNQFDCTLGKDSVKYSSGRGAFIDAYSGIKAIPTQ